MEMATHNVTSRRVMTVMMMIPMRVPDREVAVCGDRVQRLDLMPGETGYEACDDGNEDDEDACSTVVSLRSAVMALCVST